MNQQEQIKNHFKSAKSISQYQATMVYGILRLSERIRELEWQGWLFSHTMIYKTYPSGKSRKFMEYRLLGKPKKI